MLSAIDRAEYKIQSLLSKSSHSGGQESGSLPYIVVNATTGVSMGVLWKHRRST